MADDQIPTAQGQQTPAANGEASTTPQETNQFSGFQARIDELTARYHETQRRAEELMSQNNQLLAHLATREQPPVQNAPHPEIDPEEARKIAYVTEQATAPLKEQINQLLGLVGRQQVQSAVNHPALQAFGKPEVSARVQALVDGWTKQGVIQRGIATVDDAVKMAIGEAAMAELLSKKQSRDERGRFNAQPQVLAGQTSSAAPVPKAGNVNPDTLSPAEQVAYYEAKLDGTEF